MTKKTIRLRSLGSQTDMDMSEFGDMANPFYIDAESNIDDSGIEKPALLRLGNFGGPEQAGKKINTGGTIEH